MAAHENPLIPNARLRQIYVAMTNARELGSASTSSRSSKVSPISTIGLEACLVSTSIDLSAGDLVSDALTGAAVDFLRGAAATSSRKAAAKCGEASPLPVVESIAERLWAAIGASTALKSASTIARLAKKPTGTPAPNAGVILAYVCPNEASAAVWQKILQFASSQELPIVFVVLPHPRSPGKKISQLVTKLGHLSALAITCGVPGIAVDADDAVAIYRVAQESIGRARAGGGAALIECIPFTLSGKAGKNSVSPDSLHVLAQYLLQRKIVTQKWLERAGTHSKHTA